MTTVLCVYRKNSELQSCLLKTFLQMKYVCLVCPHCPVLDTMPMLCLHRQSRKHLKNTSIKIERDHRLKDVHQKQQHELYLKKINFVSTPSPTKTFKDLMECHEEAPLLIETKQITESLSKQANSQRKQSVIRNSSQVLPANLKTNKEMKNKPFFQSRIEHKLSQEHFKLDTRPCKPNGVDSLKLNDKLKSEHSLKTSCENVAGNFSQQTTSNQSNHSVYKGHSRISEEEKKRYFEMKISGWILDVKGKWVKDENAEFDSDDD
ncbi:sodium channel modifier 1-like isoform X2 [Xenia sp. Carnegie-2017]|uniref:sodium channel modifier 1-like isoform X2 n=1 Tax=Xenia sp. Carnegie-2017 TaxID=2897299 RepID=UPI001F033106|nr:sodium channel modifier 1-like isoform X2 [Xenia sp. Carnegie-2017]